MDEHQNSNIKSNIIFSSLAALVILIFCSAMIINKKVNPDYLGNPSSESTEETGENTNENADSNIVFPSDNDYSFFNDAAFLGNSYIGILRDFGIPENASFFYRVGLSVDTVMSKPMAGKNTPVIDELNGKVFSKIYLMFGENELGWPYPKKFIEKYKTVIQEVKKRQPAAKIYVQSIFPISKTESDKNIDGTNNDRINEYNEMLKIMAKEENVFFIDTASCLKNKDGVLPQNAAKDGIHFSKKYCRVWLDYLKKNP